MTRASPSGTLRLVPFGLVEADAAAAGNRLAVVARPRQGHDADRLTCIF